MTEPGNSARPPHFRDAERLATIPAGAPEPAVALLDFWGRVAGGAVPDRARLTPFDLRPWLGHLSVYERIAGSHDFTIRLEGTEISALTGEDWTGRTASAVDARFGASLLDDLTEALQTGQPVLHRIAVFQKSWRMTIRLLLPARSRVDTPPDQVFLAMFGMEKER